MMTARFPASTFPTTEIITNAKSKKNNWLKRELYYNLNYYDEIQLADSEDEEIDYDMQARMNEYFNKKKGE